MPASIDRRQVKAGVRALLRDAQKNPRVVAALYVTLPLLLAVLEALVPTPAGKATFLSLFLSLIRYLFSLVLTGGFVLYCMGIRRGERMEFSVLFDGFSFSGKIITLSIILTLLIGLELSPALLCAASLAAGSGFASAWQATLYALLSLVFLFVAVLFVYSTRFALYNLCQQPDLSAMQAIRASIRQTRGYRRQLFWLDLSFLGWTLAAELPALLLTAASSPMAPFLPSVPSWAFFLADLWYVAVSLMYLPYSRVTDLEYFEIAKSTCLSQAGLPPASSDEN